MRWNPVLHKFYVSSIMLQNELKITVRCFWWETWRILSVPKRTPSAPNPPGKYQETEGVGMYTLMEVGREMRWFLHMLRNETIPKANPWRLPSSGSDPKFWSQQLCCFVPCPVPSCQVSPLSHGGFVAEVCGSGHAPWNKPWCYSGQSQCWSATCLGKCIPRSCSGEIRKRSCG